MKFTLSLALGMIFFQGAYAETPCSDLGTSKDPYVAFMDSKKGKGSFYVPEFKPVLEMQLADTKRCKNKKLESNAKDSMKMYEIIVEHKGVTTPTPPKAQLTTKEALLPLGKVVRELKITCEYGIKKPFKIIYLDGQEDESGQVLAQGFEEELSIKLSFNNKQPKLGRTLSVDIGDTNFTKNLGGNLKEIEYASGFISKIAGIDKKYKVKCFPLKQSSVPAVSVNNGERTIIEKSSTGKTTSSTHGTSKQ